MRIILTTALVSALALPGCGGSSGGSAYNPLNWFGKSRNETVAPEATNALIPQKSAFRRERAAPEGVAVMTDISSYLDFVLKLFFAFGFAFEVPIATLLLIWAGVSTVESLSEKRPYIIVGAFVIGMLLTPPDVISQTLLAVPVWLLFELGLFCSRWLPKKADAENEDEGVTEGER